MKTRRRFLLCSLLLGLVAPFSVLWAQDTPLTMVSHPLELGLTWSQPAYRVAGVVEWMDREALMRDFPSLARLGMSDDELKSWILSNFSRVTQAHVDLMGVVAPHVEVDRQDVRRFFHPKDYHRSAIAVAKDPEMPPEAGGSRSKRESFLMVDLKGVGWGIGPFSPPVRPPVPYLVHVLRHPESVTEDMVDWARG